MTKKGAEDREKLRVSGPFFDESKEVGIIAAIWLGIQHPFVLTPQASSLALRRGGWDSGVNVQEGCT